LASSCRDLRPLASIPLPGNGCAFLPSGEAITAVPGPNSTRIVVFDPSTGITQRTVTTLDQPLILLESNPEGTSFLLVTLPTELQSTPSLYRGDLNTPHPVRLSQAAAAAWLPSNN
jgi:hypothetical protein